MKKKCASNSGVSTFDSTAQNGGKGGGKAKAGKHGKKGRGY